MEHVVFYQSAQGTPAFRRMASIEDAVSFAEHLRNVEGVTDFSVYALTPVSLKLRAYYHVEISEAGRAQARTAPAEAVAPPASAELLAVPATGTTTESSSAAAPAAPEESAAAPAAPIPPPMPPAPNPPTADRYAIPDDVAPHEPATTDDAPHADEVSAAERPAAAEMPFVAGPTATRFAQTDAFVKDDPAETNVALPPQIDPSVVDPTVEEVVPVPSGRRSMGFFTRS
jgi:hypothetical protein